MNSKTLQAQLNPFASSVVSPSAMARNASLNTALTTEVKLTSPLATVEGVSSVKGVLEFWGAVQENESIVNDASYDDKTLIMTIRSSHTYVLPLVRLVHLVVPAITRIHFVQDDGFGSDPILYADWIEQIGGVGQYVKFGGFLTLMLPEMLGPVLAFIGTQHLRLSNHLAHAKRLVETQRPPSLLAAALSPRRTLDILLAFVLFTTVSIVVGLWNRWSAFVDRLVRPIKITVDTTATHGILNTSFISHPSSAPHGQKRPHSPQNAFLAASSAAPPPSKQPRTESSTPPAAKPENLQANPVAGESYAAAVKLDPSSVLSSGPNELLPLPDLPEGTTRQTEQIDDPDSPLIEVSTTHIPSTCIDDLNLGDAVNPPPSSSSNDDAGSSSSPIATTSVTPPSLHNHDAPAPPLPTPAAELPPPSLPAAPSSLNGVSSSTKKKAAVEGASASSHAAAGSAKVLTDVPERREVSEADNDHHVVEVHSDVKGAFSYAKVAEKGEHAMASEVEL